MIAQDFYAEVDLEVNGRKVSNLYTVLWRYYFSELKNAELAGKAANQHMGLLLVKTA